MSSGEAVLLWNKMLMALVDECDELDLHPQDKGKETEALVGMQLAERVLTLEAEVKRLRLEITR